LAVVKVARALGVPTDAFVDCDEVTGRAVKRPNKKK
jgi:hypothetical protein